MTTELGGEVFRTGAVKIPLIKAATLLDARMNGGPLPVLVEGDIYSAVVTGPGSFTATLETGAPVVTTPGRGSFALPVPLAGSVVATFDVPGDETNVQVAPGLVLRRASADGRTIVDATLDPGTTAQVSWSSPGSVPSTAARPLRVLADVKTLVTIGAADVRLLAVVDLSVVQGEPSEISVQLPLGYEVTAVAGPSLDRTEEAPGRIVLFISQPAQRRHQFLLSLERVHSRGSSRFEPSFPSVPSAQRETGEIGIEGAGTLEISAPERRGLKRMDVREVDPAIASAASHPLLAAYRYYRGPDGPPSLAVEVTRFPDAACLPPSPSA
jgi:hypothetical protein